MPYRDAGAKRFPDGGRGQNGAGPRIFFGLPRPAAGNADIDDRHVAGCDAAGDIRPIDAGHPVPLRLESKSWVPHTNSTGAEAPRPARDRIDGRSPGSRVAACARLPGSLTQWLRGTGSPLTVAGAAAELEPSFHTAFPVRSRARDRRCEELRVTVRPLSMRLPLSTHPGSEVVTDLGYGASWLRPRPYPGRDRKRA